MFEQQNYNLSYFHDYGVYQNTKYGDGENIKFAFGLTKDLDPDFGTVRAYYESFDHNSNVPNFTEIKTRNCTFGDFGIKDVRTDLSIYDIGKEDAELIV